MNTESQVMRILLLEDNAADVELVEIEFRRARLDFLLRRVVTRPGYEGALRAFLPDVILCDHHLPTFTGADALKLAREIAPDVPFILLTGSLNEEIAVEYMKAGAADYILKDRLARLVPALRGALERQRTVRKLRERDQYFRSLIEHAMDIIAVLDSDGTIRYTTPSVQPLLGYAPEELGGRSMLDFLHDDDVPTTLQVFAEGVATRKGGRYLELRFRHKDGSYRMLEAVGRYLLDDPIVLGVVINARDVTDRRSLERQLLQSQKMEAVGRLASGVAHDFNNVLTAILGHAELLLDGLPKLSPLRPDLDEIRRSANRAAELTRQLLAFSRKQVLETRVLDLNGLVVNMEKMLQRLLGEDIDIVTQLDAELGSVRADAGQIEQVLVNLVVNARDAMPDGGRLTIETGNADLDDHAYVAGHGPVLPGRYVMVAISDSGVGMSAETMAHLFEPFFTTKQAGVGTGLGLAMVYGIVNQSGGYVWCYSELGHGTTFKVYLPRVDAPIDPFPTSVAERPARGFETILLLEDEDTLRDLARRLLENFGYTILEAATADEALAVAGAHNDRIHLLLADVVLPGANGRALADELLARRPELKVLFMSGYTEDAMIHRGVLTRHTAFINKPFTPDQLAAKVREVLDHPSH